MYFLHVTKTTINLFVIRYLLAINTKSCYYIKNHYWLSTITVNIILNYGIVMNCYNINNEMEYSQEKLRR